MIMLLNSGSEGIYMMKMSVECKCSLTLRARLRPSVRPSDSRASHSPSDVSGIYYVCYVWMAEERGESVFGENMAWREGGRDEGEGRCAENENGLARSVSSVLFFRTFLSAPTTTAAASAGDKLVKAESAFEQVDEDIL